MHHKRRRESRVGNLQMECLLFQESLCSGGGGGGSSVAHRFSLGPLHIIMRAHISHDCTSNGSGGANAVIYKAN